MEQIRPPCVAYVKIVEKLGPAIAEAAWPDKGQRVTVTAGDGVPSTWTVGEGDARKLVRVAKQLGLRVTQTPYDDRPPRQPVA